LNPKPWQYNEFEQTGRDYSERSEVQQYDQSHEHFRDREAEANDLLDALDLTAGAEIVDFGAGTGTFAIVAARRGLEVTAVDVSSEMISYAEDKARDAGVEGINFVHDGFLSYERPDGSADGVVSSYALHHLPDLWKGVALEQIHGMLTSSGKFFLRDVVIGDDEPLNHVQGFIDDQAQSGGEKSREDAEGHFREEFSTYDWIMEGLLERADFTIEGRSLEDGVFGEYLAVK
jgi:putative AdoMet-dependent methyltransferase